MFSLPAVFQDTSTQALAFRLIFGDSAAIGGTGGSFSFWNENLQNVFSSTVVSSFAWSIATWTDGSFVIGGARVANLTTRKYSYDGTLQWSRDHGALVESVAFDSLGNVYTGGRLSGAISSRVYDNNGTLLHSNSDSVLNYGIWATSGFYYQARGNGQITKRSATGSLINTLSSGSYVIDVGGDADGFVYAAGGGPSNVLKINKGFTGSVWTKTFGPSPEEIAVSPTGSVFIAGGTPGATGSLLRFDTNGNLIFNTSITTYQLGVDIATNGIYTAGATSRSSPTALAGQPMCSKFNYDGSLSATFSSGVQIGGAAVGVYPPFVVQ